MFKKWMLVGLIMSSSAWAAPSVLITHNKTDVESNAYIDGTPSAHPTKPHSDSKVFWNLVRVACRKNGQIPDECTALIKMAPNTPNEVAVGYVSLNLLTGEITPKEVSGNGYRIVVNGPAETTLEKLPN